MTCKYNPTINDLKNQQANNNWKITFLPHMINKLGDIYGVGGWGEKP